MPEQRLSDTSILGRISATGRWQQALGGLALAAAVLAQNALAQTAGSDRPIRLYAGFPPGSTTDVAARALAEPLGRRLGQTVVVDNRSGAGGNIAALAAAASPPDGQTIYMATTANTIGISFPGATVVDVTRAFVPVTMVGIIPNVLVAHPSLGLQSTAALIAMARTRATPLSFASSGVGTAPHLSGELFAVMARVKLLHVPYRGSTPGVTDLIAGQVQLSFAPVSSVLQPIRAGRLTALAVTSLRRSAALPELPTLDEAGLRGFDTAVWYGFMLPAGASPELVERIRAAAHAVLDAPEVQSVYRAQGIDMVRTTPEAFGQHIRTEIAKWTDLIRETGIRPE
jgi:tripartite-type tricarboxylate transporter receptor subunit TctC